jgi:hypothetical protein
MQAGLRVTLSFLLAILFLCTGISYAAQAPGIGLDADPFTDQAPAAEMTIAIFPDPRAKPMPEELWEELVAALREELTSGSPETRQLSAAKRLNEKGTDNFSPGFDEAADSESGFAPELPLQILRGDKITPGLRVDNAITVYLVGECKAIPTTQTDPFHPVRISGALGWVYANHGEIDPFIHVDCKRIGQMLGLHEMGLRDDQRQRLMANAMARVILHEWIHIATQNPHHAKSGIAKAEFGVDDLLARPVKTANHSGTRIHNGD